MQQIWEGKDVIKAGRAMIGSTNPLASAPGTIRCGFHAYKNQFYQESHQRHDLLHHTVLTTVIPPSRFFGFDFIELFPQLSPRICSNSFHFPGGRYFRNYWGSGGFLTVFGRLTA